MIRGIYQAASGLLAAQQRNDVTADNLANVNTPGFKKSLSMVKPFNQVLIERVQKGTGTSGAADVALIGNMSFGAVLNEVSRVDSQGSLVPSDIPTDLGLEGQGYFQVSTPDGIRYTRNGNFQIDATGTLVTAEGYQVMGLNGKIQGLNADIVVSEDGRVQLNDQTIDRLVIVDFPAASMQREGDSLFSTQAQPLAAENTKVRQGHIEQSNVDLAQEMVDMMTVFRSYQANQRLIVTEDGILEKTVNEIGRV